MDIRSPNIVVFDLDGTIIQHRDPRILAICEAYDDASFWIKRTLSRIFGERQAADKIITDEDLERAENGRQSLFVHRTIHRLRRKGIEQLVELRPGILEVLQHLKDNNIPVALVSSGIGSGYGHDILREFGLEDYFQATVFREDLNKSKPNPEPLLLALKRLKIKPKAEQNLWYVGDRHKDITAALAAAKSLKCTVQPIAVARNAAIAVLRNGLGSSHIMLSYDIMLRRLKDFFCPLTGKTAPGAAEPSEFLEHGKPETAQGSAPHNRPEAQDAPFEEQAPAAPSSP